MRTTRSSRRPPATPPRLVVVALGRSVTPLATTLDAYYRVQAAAHFDDSAAMDGLRRSGVAFDVAAGDTCDELIRRNDTVLVRMRDGLSAGKEGWLPAEELRPAAPPRSSPPPRVERWADGPPRGRPSSALPVFLARVARADYVPHCDAGTGHPRSQPNPALQDLPFASNKA